MLIDILIVILGLSALYRGAHSGFVRQLFAASGFFGGLFLGSWLQPHAVNLVHTTGPRAFVLIMTTLGCALLGLTLGEYIGLRLKNRFFVRHVNKIDNGLGGILGVAALLLSIWLIAAVASSLPFSGLRTTLRDSRIISELDRLLPPAPTIIAKVGRLIDPNGFPDVFIGSEPIPRGDVNLPALGDLATAVNADKDSVLRIKGQGCGGIVSGSGFVVGNGLIATNAHVVAGIQRPYAEDVNGSHSASVIEFDPNLDFAVLRAANLAGHSLAISTATVNPGTPAAVLGYPGGGDFSAGPAAVLDRIKASGRNIYGTGQTLRDIYELQANIIPGNSGGPLVDGDGSVIGVIFAESTTYNHVGYALTTSRIVSEIKQAAGHDQPVSTGRCTD